MQRIHQRGADFKMRSTETQGHKPLNITLRNTRSMLKIPALGTYTNMCIGVLKSSHSRSIFLDGTFGPRLEQLALVGHERPTF